MSRLLCLPAEYRSAVLNSTVPRNHHFREATVMSQPKGLMPVASCDPLKEQRNIRVFVKWVIVVKFGNKVIDTCSNF